MEFSEWIFEKFSNMIFN